MLKVAIVGRPNVGKSTLFNSLVRAREALVAEVAGLTRDRRYGIGDYGKHQWLLIDTGGIVFDGVGLERQILWQTRLAIDEADLICLVVCAQEGLVPLDLMIVEELRRTSKPLWLIMNKLDGRDESFIQAEFSKLGIRPSFCATALHGRYVDNLRQTLAEYSADYTNGAVSQNTDETTIRLAFLGRPNAGKSTLINKILGEERLLTSDRGGTTRDSIAVSFKCNDIQFLLIDTAGIRRRKATTDAEKLSVLNAFENALASDVAILVCSAEEVAEQDASLAAQALKAGCALVVALNKSDLISRDNRVALRDAIDRRLRFLRRFDIVFVSALNGSGIERLLRAAQKAWQAAQTRLTASQCTRMLQSAVSSHQPPLVGGGHVKLRYAHQGGVRPPRFIIYGSRVDRLTYSYRRYLENFFRKELHLVGTPLALEFRRTENPYRKQ